MLYVVYIYMCYELRASHVNMDGNMHFSGDIYEAVYIE
jgi:hypothetical protein